ncbi:MAG: S1 family peptidase [Labilithrix sp.]|nr:S1 family peptidase [Labilithrix sp.]
MHTRSFVAAGLAVLGLVSGCAAESGGAESDSEPEAAATDAIVGGAETKAVAAVGYLVAVLKKGDKTYTTGPFCTGTLIAPDVVLSAGHCFPEGRPAPEGYTLAGFAFGTGTVDAGELTMVSTLETHPKFTAEHDYQHDVAWLVLEKPVRNVAVGKVRRSAHRGHCDYVAIGYGVNKEGAFPDDELAPGESGVRKSLAMCADRGLVEGMIQTYNGDRGTPCYGDSGGALRVKDTMEIVGVTSFGTSGCEKNGYVYYAPLAKNLDFIDEGLARSKHR